MMKWGMLWITAVSIIELLSPYLIKRMIEWIQAESFDPYEGFYFAVGMGLVTSIKIYGFRRSTTFVCFAQARTMLMISHLVFKKLGKLSSSTLSIVELGNITSLTSSDAMSITQMVFFINVLVSVPILIIAITIILVIEFGYISLATPVVFAFLTYVQQQVTNYNSRNIFG